MAIRIIGGSIKNCGTGVRVDGDVDLHVDGLEISETRIAYDIRKAPGLLEQLGFSPDTPIEQVNALMEGLLAMPPKSQEEVQRRMEGAGLTLWLGAAANAATVAHHLWSWAQPLVKMLGT